MTNIIETESNVYQIEVTEILAKLDQGQRDTIANWLAKQHRLEVEGPNGFSNVSVVVAWLLTRNYPITEANLTTALGNAQTNGHRQIFWKDVPQESREYVLGRPNHAFKKEEPKAVAASVQSEFYPNGRRNHNYQPPEVVVQKKSLETDGWQFTIDRLLTEWIVPSQQVKLQAEYDAGVAAGKNRREIAVSLGSLVRDMQRGR